jgi:hypothetical protein
MSPLEKFIEISDHIIHNIMIVTEQKECHGHAVYCNYRVMRSNQLSRLSTNYCQLTVGWSSE